MRDLIKYVWVGVILAIGVESYAQFTNLRIVDEEDLGLFYSEMMNSQSNALKYSDIEGSPYYSDDFKSSDVYLKNGKLIKQVSIRLNLYNKTLEFKRDGEILEMTRMDGLDQVIINDEQIIYVNEAINSGDAGFYKIEVDGRYKLMELLQVTFFEATKATSNYQDDIPAEFKRQKGNYYLGTDKKPPLAFGNKKDFQNSFAHSYSSLVEYAKKNRLNTKKYDDLVKMVNYLNTSNDKSTN